MTLSNDATDQSLDKLNTIAAGFGIRDLAAPRHPIYVSGVPRSGTTVVGRILDLIINDLDNDPMESFGVEFIFNLDNKQFRNRAMAFLGGQSPQVNTFKYLLEQLSKGQLSHTEVCRGYFTLAANRRNSVQFVEKTPSNVVFAQQLFAAFPDAALIFCVRHPLQVYISYRERLKRELSIGNIRDISWLDKDPREFAQFYKHYCNKCRELITNKHNVAVIKYEQLSSADLTPLKQVMRQANCVDIDAKVQRHHADVAALFEGKQYSVNDMLSENECRIIKEITESSMHWLGYQ